MPGAEVVAKTKNALRILAQLTAGDEQIEKGIEQAKINHQIAAMIYDARTRAGFSQRELAGLAGTRQPVIARLESATYEGHSLSMLQRIAGALRQRLVARFEPDRSSPLVALGKPRSPRNMREQRDRQECLSY